MNACEPFARAALALRSGWPILALLTLALGIAGCTGQRGAPPPGGQLNIERAAKWYQLYRADHGNKTPPNEQAFLSYIAAELKQRGENVPDDLLISPRDGKKYIVNYGKPTSNNAERNVAVYEAEGYGGKKWVAFESAYALEVDDAELQKFLAGQ